MDTILKTTELCKYYKKQKAVDNISLEIERNTVYGLFGAKRCGKIHNIKNVNGYAAAYIR